jgi:hypothetical protein
VGAGEDNYQNSALENICENIKHRHVESSGPQIVAIDLISSGASFKSGHLVTTGETNHRYTLAGGMCECQGSADYGGDVRNSSTGQAAILSILNICFTAVAW